MPAAIPTSPRQGLIIFGLVLIAFAAWLLLSFLPEHKPWTDADVAHAGIKVIRGDPRPLVEWRFNPQAYRLAYGFALLVGLLGISSAVRGATWQEHKEIFCRTCAERVIARKKAFSTRCPIGHTVEVNVVAMALLTLFSLGVFLVVRGILQTTN